MLNALVNEQEKPVRNAIAQLIGNLVKHDSNTNESWMVQVLKFVFEYCGSNNPQQSEVSHRNQLTLLTKYFKSSELVTKFTYRIHL